VHPPQSAGTVQAPAEVVAHALGPLLENAVRHAASRVEVSADARPDELAMVVADDGPGLAGADADVLFEPGMSTTGGAGLGLALARRLARSSGGDVVAVAGALGGRFELTLPRVGASAS
jgi:two-component system OmpR family sensor kinase